MTQHLVPYWNGNDASKKIEKLAPNLHITSIIPRYKHSAIYTTIGNLDWSNAIIEQSALSKRLLKTLAKNMAFVVKCRDCWWKYVESMRHIQLMRQEANIPSQPVPVTRLICSRVKLVVQIAFQRLFPRSLVSIILTSKVWNLHSCILGLWFWKNSRTSEFQYAYGSWRT